MFALQAVLPLLTSRDRNRKSDAKCTFLGRKLKDVNSVQFYAFSIHHHWVRILLIEIEKYLKLIKQT